MTFKHKKRKRVSKRLKKFLKDNDLNNIYKNLRHSKDSKDFFDFSNTDKSKISYLKVDRIPEQTHLIFNNEYRTSKGYHTRIGKLINTDIIPQVDIQKVSALLHNRAFDSKIIITSEIMHYYLEDNYADGNGSLNKSCMKSYSCQDYISAYESFGSDNVQLLVLLNDDGLVIARALLWYKVEYNNTDIPDYTPYMDRVYAINDNISQVLYSYAESKNYQHYKSAYHKMKIRIVIDEDMPLPYFDTFDYYNYNDLNNSCGEYSLISTKGTNLLGDSTDVECIECGCSQHGDDMFYSDVEYGYLCSNCGIYIDDYVYKIDDCIQLNGRWYLKESKDVCYSDYDEDYYLLNDCCYSEYHNSYLLYDDSVFSEYHDDSFLFDDVHYIENINDYILKNDDSTIQVDYDGKYYLKEDDDIIYIEQRKKYYHINDSLIIYDDDKQEYIYHEHQEIITV